MRARRRLAGQREASRSERVRANSNAVIMNSAASSVEESMSLPFNDWATPKADAMTKPEGHTATSSGLSDRPLNSRTAIHMMAPDKIISAWPKATSGGLFEREAAAAKPIPAAMTSWATPHQPMSGLDRSCHQTKHSTSPTIVVAEKVTTEMVGRSSVIGAPRCDPMTDHCVGHSVATSIYGLSRN